MALWFAALMGLIQGLTEFLPISSSAHLRIAPAIFGQPDPGPAFTAVIQLGTLLAVVAYFAKDLASLTTAMFREPSSPDGRLPLLLAAGTVPIVIAGLAMKKHIEGDLRSLYVTAAVLIGFSLVMLIIDRFAAGRDPTKPFASLTLTDALLIGLAQTLALVPGVSRSGATICMALLIGMTRSDAARFSFLLSIPAIAGAGIFEMRDALKILGQDAIPALAIGTTVSFITGYAAIAWLIKWLSSHDLIVFIVYRIIAGGALLIALLCRLL
ncbi:MAG: undecaprenyl-diphosphatase UppP [Deltaproteobacteria bacterium]|nr:undecaprenyl-diphosphatase UppP [Deltaproteobacteria bacterium]